MMLQSKQLERHFIDKVMLSKANHGHSVVRARDAVLTQIFKTNNFFLYQSYKSKDDVNVEKADGGVKNIME